MLGLAFIKYLLCLFFSLSAYEVPAAATEVLGVSGGRQSAGGFAGSQRRADATQIQHRSHPCAQRVLFVISTDFMAVVRSLTPSTQIQTVKVLDTSATINNTSHQPQLFIKRKSI